jgi:hypothetical protein
MSSDDLHMLAAHMMSQGRRAHRMAQEVAAKHSLIAHYRLVRRLEAYSEMQYQRAIRAFCIAARNE